MSSLSGDVRPSQGGGSDIFLRMATRRAGKVKGEATSPGHEGEVGVLRWRWGAQAGTAVGSTAASSRRSYRHLELVKRVDSATTALLAALATNDEVKEATLILRKAGDGQLDYFTLKLSAARVTSVDHVSDDTGNTLETVTLAFNKVELEYRAQQAGGGLGAAFVFQDEIVAV